VPGSDARMHVVCLLLNRSIHALATEMSVENLQKKAKGMVNARLTFSRNGSGNLKRQGSVDEPADCTGSLSYVALGWHSCLKI
jgi:hypothetical protein